jgi:hypothetical protein
MAHGEDPVRSHDRSSLRVLGSTGEPWNPEPWWWYFREVGEGRCPIVNYSGGTEVSGGIVGGNVIGPIKPASFSGPCIGTAADVVDDAAVPLRGKVGELVIRAPFPGMTRGFWRDPARYEETYWSRWPGLWAHGDWASVDADGFWYIHGRSDDTLKVAGKRVGPAEVESAAVAHPAVLEAAAIGVPHEIKGEVIVVLCVLRPGEVDDADLRRRWRSVSPMTSESPSSPTRSRSSRHCPRHAQERSCGASSGRRGSVSIRVTCRRSTTRHPSRRGDRGAIACRDRLNRPRPAEPARGAASEGTMLDGTMGPIPRYPAGVTGIAAPERDIVSWEDLDRLVADLGDRLAGQTFDVLLAITRGGMVPAGMLAYRLRLRDILVAAVEYYDDTGQPGPTPTVLPVPGRPIAAREARPDRRRGLGQRHHHPRRHRASPSGRG